ncbi:MAG: hypothetical protein KDC61_11810 [Saprospiraceae bacterium]|nr:hypothetical protein [Saprospiraceae bacterium]
MSLPTQNVEKIAIQAYSDAKMTAAVGQPFFIPINPETYSEKRQVKQDSNQGIGNQGNNPKYGGTSSEELKLDFIFDGTGTVEGNRLKDTKVSEQVTMFLDTVYYMDGKSHKPYYLKIQWGKYLTFPSVLTTVDINYVLFDRDGSPLRAKVSATFLGYTEREKRIKLEDKSSPDLTHSRTVIQGSRLDLMTHEMYGDSKYMLQVARANGLTSLRPIKAGIQLEFPPFDKKEEA